MNQKKKAFNITSFHNQNICPVGGRYDVPSGDNLCCCMSLCSVGLFIFHQKQCPSAVVVFATIGSTSQMEYKDMLYEIHEINMV